MATPKVENRDFVVAYATAWTVEDVVKATGMNKPAIYARAKFLRDKGVKLPKLQLKPPVDNLEVAQLNSLVKKHDIRARQQQN